MKALRKCVMCGQEFRPFKSSHICCSKKCGNARYRRASFQAAAGKEMRKCAMCGREFAPIMSTQRLCPDPECRRRYDRERAQRFRDASKLRAVIRTQQSSFSCPWATGLIRGTALGADPVLGF